MNDKVLSIHYLRGIAGLFVVLFHFRGYLNNVYAQSDLGQILFNSGAFGVDLFFMISGFIIALSTEKRTSKISFAIRRFFRIYPCFVVVFLIGVVFVYRFDPEENLLRGFFFIHRDYSEPAPGFGYNVLGPAWTLTYEIYFYTAFCAAMSISHKYRTLISSIAILMIMFSLQMYFNGRVSLSGHFSAHVDESNPAYGLLRFISSPILFEFVVGMLFYELYKIGAFSLSKKTATFTFFLCVGFFTTFYFSGKFFGFGVNKAGIISIALFIGFIVYGSSIGFKDNKTISFLGDISFSIYISHYFFINMFNFYQPDFYMQTTGIARLCMMLTITISAGAILHLYVEKPFISIGKKLEKKLI
ncbi:acyltransferase family protein [Enterobacter kobei]|uniref:acyltransferase family protein n=1 Tax=Enterobacter kobei TaxID=208224 RepID=UPI001C6FD403|nr:acyltransferase [Enterobacter kobei]MBW9428687.1 acyltransferase [Enterobacter kobei]